MEEEEVPNQIPVLRFHIYLTFRISYKRILNFSIQQSFISTFFSWKYTNLNDSGSETGKYETAWIQRSSEIGLERVDGKKLITKNGTLISS